MAYTKISPLTDQQVAIVNRTAGSSSGSTVYLPVPFRGQLLDGGFIPQSVITSDTTFALAVVKLISSTASLVTEVVTSTLGTFSSLNLTEGFIASVNPPSPVYVNAGDTLKCTTSGGQTSLVAATVFANFRRG